MAGWRGCLTFKDQALELRYWRHRTLVLRGSIDHALFFSHFLINVFFNLSLLIRGVDRWSLQLAGIYFSLLGAHGAALLWLDDETFLRVHGYLYAVLRLAFHVVCAYGLPLWTSSSVMATSLPLVLHQFLWVSGVLSQLWVAMTPSFLSFKLHLAAQLFAMIVYIANNRESACALVCEDASAVRILARAWDLLEGASSLLLVHPDGCLVPLAHQPPAPSPMASCSALFAYTQVLLGFLLPTSALYCLERNSREYFLEQHPQPSPLPPEQPPPAAPAMKPGMAVAQDALQTGPKEVVGAVPDWPVCCVGWRAPHAGVAVTIHVYLAVFCWAVVKVLFMGNVGPTPL